MQRSTPFLLSPRFPKGISALAVLLAASSAATCEEPSATAHVWGSSGPGQVDSHSATATPGGSGGGSANSVNALAIGCYAHADGLAATGSNDPDVGLRAKAQSQTSYELTAMGCCTGGTTWMAAGTMSWTGSASASTALDADASATGSALLVYSGDLALKGCAAVAATSGSGATEVEWEVSLTPSYTTTYTRTNHVETDEESGGCHAQTSGSGTAVRVDVHSYGDGEIVLDTNCFGFGLARGEFTVTNRGAVTLTITTTCNHGPDPTAPGNGGGYPTSGGGNGGCPWTVETPRTKVFKVRIDGSEPPVSVEGGVPTSPDMPEPPKQVQGPSEGGN